GRSGCGATMSTRRDSRRPERRKRADQLQESCSPAMPRILDRHPWTTFVIVGGGSSGDSAKRAAEWLPASLRGEHRVRFLGWQPTAGRFYRRCHILVVPSRYEPFGMVILEGMRAGIAI